MSSLTFRLLFGAVSPTTRLPDLIWLLGNARISRHFVTNANVHAETK